LVFLTMLNFSIKCSAYNNNLAKSKKSWENSQFIIE
jgi:hypothetical protein